MLPPSLLPDSRQVLRFERGFKTWSENTAVTIRRRLNMRDIAPLSPKILAKHVGVQIWDIHTIPGLPSETLAYLSSPEGDEWSAVTVCVGTFEVIIVNPCHSLARQASDIAHEMAHVIRGHKPAQIYISEVLGVQLRTYDPLQEAEANWLSGCLLLPRSAIVYAIRQGMTKEQASDHFGVSQELYTYRMNVTGVSRQFNNNR